MSCLFCSMIDGTIPVTKIGENDQAIAIMDIHPAAPVHALVIPRKHCRDITELNAAQDKGAQMAGILDLIATVTLKAQIRESGFRVISNQGPDASQSVFHLHFHVLGGAKLQAGLDAPGR